MEGDRVTPAREDPHSLAPIQIEISNIDEDIARLKRGKSARLLIAALCSGLAAFGVAKWMDTIDGSQQYAAAAERLDAINAQQANALLRCLLPDLQRSQLASRQALHTAFEIASDRAQKYYGKQLKQCSRLSEELVRRLDNLDVPTDLAPSLQTLRSSAGDLNHALGNYRMYLQDPARPYDFVQATPLIEHIANAWTTYEERRAQLNDVLRNRP
jgi:hypothetical protein